MWMDLYNSVRTPVILFGIGIFVLALLMLVKDWAQNKDRKASGISMFLVLVLIALATSMI